MLTMADDPPHGEWGGDGDANRDQPDAPRHAAQPRSGCGRRRGRHATPGGWHALAWAGDEAAATGAHLTICHAGPPPPAPTTVSTIDTLELADPVFARFVHQTRRRLGGERVALRFEAGEPAEVLCATAHGTDTLVIGAPAPLTSPNRRVARPSSLAPASLCLHRQSHRRERSGCGAIRHGRDRDVRPARRHRTPPRRNHLANRHRTRGGLRPPLSGRLPNRNAPRTAAVRVAWPVGVAQVRVGRRQPRQAAQDPAALVARRG
jgi:hypothetical protein